MRFSFIPAPNFTWKETLGLFRHAEDVGFDRLLYADHLLAMGDRGEVVNEGWTTLAAVAATVPRVRIGTLVSCNNFRHPSLLAKMAANLDHISGGRLILGMGSGWYEPEHLAYGFPFYSAGERLSRLEEALQVLSSLFNNDRTNFNGRYYQLVDAPLAPKPIQRPLPLMLGASAPRGIRLAARFANEWNVNNWISKPDSELRPEVVRLFERCCQDYGRDPKSIDRSVVVFIGHNDDADTVAQLEFYKKSFTIDPIIGDSDYLCTMVERFAAAGFTDMNIASLTMGTSYDSVRKGMERWITRVGRHFQS